MPTLATEVTIMTSDMRFKGFKFESYDAATGEVSGYASKFHNIDGYGDIVMPGAFTKSLQGGAGKIKFLWQHDRYTPIGVIKELREDEKGLYFKAQFANTQKAQEARELMSMGAMDSFSIGYIPVIEEKDEANGRAVNRIREVRLLEISSVTFPANTEATLDNIKSDTESKLAGLRMDQLDLVTKFIDFMQASEEEPQDEQEAPEVEAVTTSDEDTSEQDAINALVEKMEQAELARLLTKLQK